MRQACVWNKYAPANWWGYVTSINTNCSKSNIDSCWKKAAASVGINTTAVEDCVAAEGVGLMRSETVVAEHYGVDASPTIIINGARYSGARTPEDFKNAVCTAFSTLPAECAQLLSSTESTPVGGCAA